MTQNKRKVNILKRIWNWWRNPPEAPKGYKFGIMSMGFENPFDLIKIKQSNK